MRTSDDAVEVGVTLSLASTATPSAHFVAAVWRARHQQDGLYSRQIAQDFAVFLACWHCEMRWEAVPARCFGSQALSNHIVSNMRYIYSTISILYDPHLNCSKLLQI